MPQGHVELGPNLGSSDSSLLGGGGHFAGGTGDGGIPAHSAGDDDVQPAQQGRGQRGAGLSVGEPVCWRWSDTGNGGHYRVVVHGAQVARQAASRSRGRPRREISTGP